MICFGSAGLRQAGNLRRLHLYHKALKLLKFFKTL